MTSHYDIKGIPVKGGDIPVRSEFSTWATNPESNIQVSLMIRALQRFYQVPITDTKSYFQIAGESNRSAVLKPPLLTFTRNPRISSQLMGRFTSSSRNYKRKWETCPRLLHSFHYPLPNLAPPLYATL